MFASAALFLDFNLPNATTWLYFSFLLAVALFFKFSRVFSVRNLDILALFLLAPGFLLLQNNRVDRAAASSPQTIAAAIGVGKEPLQGLTVLAKDAPAPINWTWIGYIWLMCGSGYFFARCVFDLVLVQRPALGPNLSFGGLAWLAGAMFVFLMVVAFRQPDRTQPSSQAPTSEGVQGSDAMVGKESALFALAKKWITTRPWMTRGFAGLCHFFVVVGLLVVCARHFKDPISGMAAAAFYLMLPYTSFYVSQAHHVWPSAMVVWALVVFRYPTLSGLLLGLAAGTMYFPFLLFPIWFSFYWKRGVWRFVAAFALAVTLCLGTMAIDLWMLGDLEQGLRDVWSLSPWNSPDKTHSEGFWTGVHFAYRIPIFVGHLAFVLATFFWPAPKNLAHVIALSTAVLIGLQFWYADQGGVYVLWYLPLLLLLVFRPNLSDCRPDPILREQDWLYRWGRRVSRWVLWRKAPAGI